MLAELPDFKPCRLVYTSVGSVITRSGSAAIASPEPVQARQISYGELRLKCAGVSAVAGRRENSSPRCESMPVSVPTVDRHCS